MSRAATGRSASLALPSTASHRTHARAGLARTFQGGGLFDDLSVQDNLLVAAAPSAWQDIAADVFRPWRRRTRIDAVERSLELCGLVAERGVKVQELPHGTRRLVGIARALASRPRLLLLDEPAAGLDSLESWRLGQSIRRLADDGLAVLLVEHDVDLVFGICDTVHVLDVGAVIARGTPEEIRRNRLVIEAYLGSQSRDRRRESDPGGQR